MKINRRTLIGRAIAAAAALGAVGSVTPKVEAAPEMFKIIGGEAVGLDPVFTTVRKFNIPQPDQIQVTHGTVVPAFDDRAFLASVERGIKGGTLDDDMTLADWQWVEQEARSGQQFLQPLTFEAIQADCEARGCRLVKIFEGYPRSAFVFHHDAEPWRPATARRYEMHAEDGQRYVDRKSEALIRVDAWRRSLHRQAG